MEPRHALRDGFSRWLDEIVRPQKIRMGRQLEPFGTSLRNTGRMVPWLGETQRGEALSIKDKVQTVADMRAIGLVVGHHPDQRLTELGERVLERWRAFGVENDDRLEEVARCAVLFRAAVEHGLSRYCDMYAFWCELVDLQPADYWLADVFTMYLPSYLNQEDEHGYNPFRVLVGTNRGDIGSEAQWREWAEQDWDGSEKLAHLIDKIRTWRPGGRRAFCRAMEAYRLVQNEPRSLPGTLIGWGIPNA